MWTPELFVITAQYVAVVFIGAFIGMGELVSRYKDDPYEAITNRHAITYTLLNVLASAVALLALKTMNDPTGKPDHVVGETLLAGFGAMGVLRSSAFTMRVGKDDIAIGPSALLQILLSATDRAVDRARARVRAEKMAKTMQSVPFEQLEESLPQLAFTMMQNVTEQEKQGFANEIKGLREKNMDTVAKSICMGLSLSNIVGQGVVDDAVMALRNSLAAAGDPKLAAAPAASPPAPAPVEDAAGKEAPVPPTMPN